MVIFSEINFDSNSAKNCHSQKKAEMSDLRRRQREWVRARRAVENAQGLIDSDSDIGDDMHGEEGMRGIERVIDDHRNDGTDNADSSGDEVEDGHAVDADGDMNVLVPVREQEFEAENLNVEPQRQ